MYWPRTKKILKTKVIKGNMSDGKCYVAFSVITFGLKWYKTGIFYTDDILCVGVIFLPFVRDEKNGFMDVL